MFIINFFQDINTNLKHMTYIYVYICMHLFSFYIICGSYELFNSFLFLPFTPIVQPFFFYCLLYFDESASAYCKLFNLCVHTCIGPQRSIPIIRGNIFNFISGLNFSSAFLLYFIKLVKFDIIIK